MPEPAGARPQQNPAQNGPRTRVLNLHDLATNVAAGLIVAFAGTVIFPLFSKYNYWTWSLFLGSLTILVTSYLFVLWKRLLNNIALATTTYFSMLGVVLLILAVFGVMWRQEWHEVTTSPLAFNPGCEYRATITEPRKISVHSGVGDGLDTGHTLNGLALYATSVDPKQLIFFFSDGNERMLNVDLDAIKAAKYSIRGGEIRDANGTDYKPDGLFVGLILQQKCS